jgi:hypothetical protein
VIVDCGHAPDHGLDRSIMNYWQAAIEDIGPGGVDDGLFNGCRRIPIRATP